MNVAAPAGPEAAAAGKIALLHGLDGEGGIEPGTHLVPGLWFAVDRDQGAMTGRWSAAPGRGLRFDFDVVRPGRWLSLNLALGGEALLPGQALGVALRTEVDAGAAAVPFVLRLRSGLHAGGFADLRLGGDHAATPGQRTVLALIEADAEGHEVLREPAPWRNLMMVFEPASFGLRLRDLRVFVAALPPGMAG